jgi:hypothetical protein
MPKATPAVSDLVDAVREFMERDLLPAVSDDLRFQCRVAINVLGIVIRELELAPAQHEAERQRLALLLGHEGSIDELNRELARRIREGEMGADTPSLLDHLRATSVEALRIDNPKWIEPGRLKSM